MKSRPSALTHRKIREYCDLRLAPILRPEEVGTLQRCLVGLLERAEYPPYRGSGLDVRALAKMLSMDELRLTAVRSSLHPIFDAVARSIAEQYLRAGRRPNRSGEAGSSDHGVTVSTKSKKAASGRKRGPRPKSVVEFPEPLEACWEEPDGFGAALRLHAKRHGETVHHLYNAVVTPEDGINRSTLHSWARGVRAPRSSKSLEILRRIERRYCLPEGYFVGRMGGTDRAPGDFDLDEITPAERRRLAWHLPEDFNRRSRPEQARIGARRSG